MDVKEIELSLTAVCRWCGGTALSITYKDCWCGACGGSGRASTHIRDRFVGYRKAFTDHPPPYKKEFGIE